MVAVVLQKPDVALLSDLLGTRIRLEALTGQQPQISVPMVTTRFVGGNKRAYRGEGVDESWQFEAHFSAAQHAEALRLTNLFRFAHEEAADARLQVRTRFGAVGGLDPVQIVVVPQWQPARLQGRRLLVSFAAEVVSYSAVV